MVNEKKQTSDEEITKIEEMVVEEEKTREDISRVVVQLRKSPEELQIELKKNHVNPYDDLYYYNGNISDVDKVLIRLRKNCVYLSIYHNRRYHFYKNILFCIFNVPLIVISGLNSFFAVGTQRYFTQETISLVNAILSLFCGILTSVELLWQLKERTQRELLSHKEYYKLSLDIFNFLQLDEVVRMQKGTQFLTETYTMYKKYVESGNAINVYRRGFLDELEYVSEEDKKDLKYVLRLKKEKDKKIYYCSQCCL